MARSVAPTTELELAETIAGSDGFFLQGSGSKSGLGRLLQEKPILSLKAFNGIEIYEPEELVLEAGAATPLRNIQKALDAKSQMLAFEPPDYSHLWSGKALGSLGGLVACGFSGPRRIKAGALRDHILGARGVTGRGEIFKAGARVVKNVTGYDMPKLVAGSFGTLAALTSITMKVLPAPETEETICVAGLSDAQAIAVMSQALQSSTEVSAAAHVPGQATYLRLEGIAVSVKARREKLRALLSLRSDIMDAKASRSLWATIRDCKILPMTDDHCLWRISVAPSEGGVVAARIAQQVHAKFHFDWGGGLIWMAIAGKADGGAAVIRNSFTEGHATLFKAPDAVRETAAVFHPQAAAAAALTRRIKLAFDPQQKLNASLMYEGV